MDGEIYFHINNIIKNNGDIIEPGSMGAFIENNYLLNNPPNEHGFDLAWRLLQEQTFELIRHRNFNEKPSRYKSIFLFKTLEQVSAFKSKKSEFARQNSPVYQVKIIDNASHVHCGCMDRFGRIPIGRPVLPAIESQATEYWRGVPCEDPEWLTESSVEVLGGRIFG